MPDYPDKKRPYRPDNREDGGFANELADLDDRLIGMLIRRCRIMGERVVARRRGGKNAVDPDLEKMLWKVWSNPRTVKAGFPTATLRQIFGLLNTLAYQDSEPRSDSRRDFTLAPGPGPVSVEMVGPSDVFQTRILALLAAVHGTPCVITGAVRNDPLIDLVKCLNYVGASLSWNEDTVVNEPRKLNEGEALISLDNKSIFVGADPLNMALMIGLSLSEAGRLKIMGGAELAGLNLAPISAMLPVLGARLTRVNPNVTGLPARIESCGMMAHDIKLTADFPEYFAVGLLAAATTYPDGLAVSWPADWPGVGLVRRLADVLRSVGIKAALSGNRIEIRPGKPKFPASMTPDIDLGLAAPMLALPRLRGGRARLIGSVDPSDWLTGALEELLAAAGVVLAVDGGGLSAAIRPWPENPVFKPVGPFLPLASALAMCAPEGGTVVVPDGADQDLVRDFAATFGADCQPEGEDDARLRIGRASSESALMSYSAPDPAWAMACAVAACAYPGVVLGNPGVMTAAWPAFWNTYNTLPVIEIAEPVPMPAEDDHDAGKSKRRRIRI